MRRGPGETLEIGEALRAVPGHGQPGGHEGRFGSPLRTLQGRPPKVAAEGVEALKELEQTVNQVLTQLIGGIQSGMGYLGAADLRLREHAASSASPRPEQRESAPHDVIEVKSGK